MKRLLLIFGLAFCIFFPSLFVFYTNDDFFFLKISHVSTLPEIANFFNLLKSPEGFGMYRPLTTQLFYFLAWKFFNLDPLGLHVISFLVFFGIIYLVYKFALEVLENEKIALISAFLYATSATHFAHLYYLATFQELGMTLFVLLSCLTFVRGKNLLSLIFFILGILSKETAVVTPLLLVLLGLFKQKNIDVKINLKKLILRLLPFLVCLFAYLFIRINWYGFSTGDSYIWDFSVRKMINTSAWYLVWSLNIPETLVDFIGPGLRVNPNLWLYWSKEIYPILALFLLQGTIIVGIIFKSLFNKNKTDMAKINKNSIFCMSWFLISLLPVIFLPIHKFTFYLTLPLIGLIFRISYLMNTSKVNNFFIGLFLVIWTGLSILTINFTVQTNWITQGEIISKRVFDYFNKLNVSDKKIVFVDTYEDTILPWSPTLTVKTALSDINFFKVFFPNIANHISYRGDGQMVVKSRQFLGY